MDKRKQEIATKILEHLGHQNCGNKCDICELRRDKLIGLLESLNLGLPFDIIEPENNIKGLWSEFDRGFEDCLEKFKELNPQGFKSLSSLE